MSLSIEIAPDDSPAAAGLCTPTDRPNVGPSTLEYVARILMLEYPGLRVTFDPVLGTVSVLNVRIVTRGSSEREADIMTSAESIAEARSDHAARSLHRGTRMTSAHSD